MKKQKPEISVSQAPAPPVKTENNLFWFVIFAIFAVMIVFSLVEKSKIYTVILFVGAISTLALYKLDKRRV